MTCSYRFISEHRAAFGVALLCRVLAVRRPGFYEWIAAAPVRAAHAAAEEELATEIAEVHTEHRKRYGCPRVTIELVRLAEGPRLARGVTLPEILGTEGEPFPAGARVQGKALDGASGSECWP
ncbi:hypothetical protein [Amycolatopsis sp. H20-H5]|uniref:hypothetical protein n=1 Tax=Amycolatopsis sp. H20-H5 TaxID=3046309 RepID=UPI002DBFBC58|nr:hypothetical protein [Amycolatopsis sp. H20-H5]MEC3980361.1 hypothetical protein [Amycolatopsis sp. H20-H5]